MSATTWPSSRICTIGNAVTVPGIARIGYYLLAVGRRPARTASQRRCPYPCSVPPADAVEVPSA